MQKLKRSRWLVGIVAAVAVLCFLGLAALYSLVGNGRVQSSLKENGGEGHVTVYLTLSAVDAATGTISADVSVAPWSPDETSSVLPKDVELVVSPLVGEQSLKFPANVFLGSKGVTASTMGDIANWPFDRQEVTLGMVGCTPTCFSDATKIVPLDVVLDGRVNGWEISATADKEDRSDGTRVVRLVATRSVSTIAFGALLLVVLACNAVVATVITSRLARGRWKFEPSFAGWMAGMLFAIVPLRGFLPGAPPVGSWIDYLVVLWVIVILVANMAVYLLRGTKDRTPAPAPPPAGAAPDARDSTEKSREPAP